VLTHVLCNTCVSTYPAAGAPDTTTQQGSHNNASKQTINQLSGQLRCVGQHCACDSMGLCVAAVTGEAPYLSCRTYVPAVDVVIPARPAVQVVAIW
jgi:hypothetical protein